MEEMHQHKVAQMIKSAEGSAGLLHKNFKAHSMVERGADLGRRRRCEVAGSLCSEKERMDNTLAM